MREDTIETIVFMLYLDCWLDEDEYLEDMEVEVIDSLRLQWVEEWLPSLDKAHFGDCTNHAVTCTRCTVEGLYSSAKKFLPREEGK